MTAGIATPAASDPIETGVPAGPAEPEAPVGRRAPPIGPDAPILGIMSTTRAIRHLAPDPVPEDVIRSVIEAATWAPTGSNAQGESFVVVTDHQTIARLAVLWRRVVDDFRTMVVAAAPGRAATPASERVRESVEYQRDHFEEIPVIVVACYDMRPQRPRSLPRAFAAIIRAAGVRRTMGLLRAYPTLARRSEAASIYPAVENLLLAARAHGLAACLTTWHLLAEAEFRRILGIPAGVETFAVIPIGWPLRPFGAVRRRPVDEVIHRDRW